MRITPPVPRGPDGRVLAFAPLPVAAPLDALRAELASLLGLAWVDHVNLRDYVGGWDVLPLRCLREHVGAHPVLQGFAIGEGGHWQDLPVLDDCPALRGVLAGLRCPLQSARLMRLRAGAAILPHRDHGLGLEYGQARLHLAIQTSDEVDFIVAGRRLPMAPGELWYFNADLVHEVRNRGAQDRIHLVVDCEANDWLRDQLLAGAPVFADPGTG